MTLPWVDGLIRGRMKNAQITAEVVGREQMTTDRPASLEASGADRTVYERLRQRGIDFEFETHGFMGGALAWILPTYNLELLPDNLMPRLDKFNREPLNAHMYVALVRNAGAPTIQFCAEPAGGMPEDSEVDWLFDLLDEGTELGVYNDDGWLGFRLPSDLQHYQDMLDEKQAGWWGAVRPNLKRVGWADIKFSPVGQDTFNGQKGIICPCMTAGEFSFVKVGTIDLASKGWKLLDLECRKAGDSWQPLNRKVVGIVPRQDKSPMLYEFAREGGLDHCGMHFPLSGEVIEYVLSHLSIPLLGPHGLNWLK